MIAAAVCIGNRQLYERYAAPSLADVLPGSPVGEVSTDSIFSGYNEALDAFADFDDLEALVLMHEDVTIEDHCFADKIRESFSDPNLGILGVVGARNVRSLCWWEGDMEGRVAESRGSIDHWHGPVDVDCVDGLILILAPWVVRNLRFDSRRFHGFHGYDVDFCFEVHAAGRRVRIGDLHVTHHPEVRLRGDESFWNADLTLRQKWSVRGRTMASDSEMNPHMRHF